MLLRSGDNLTDYIIRFVNSSNSLFIFVSYIKLEPLKKILAKDGICKAIIVRWEPKDLLEGASDLEVFRYCKENDIALYRNSRLHLKAFIDCNRRCIQGSANISARALNLDYSDKYNYELATEISLGVEDKLYFEVIISESTLITDSIYDQIKQQLIEFEKGFIKVQDFDLKIVPPDKDFLLSSLPLSHSVENLIATYNDPENRCSQDIDCMVHDLALYKIPLGLNEKEFISHLKSAFFSHSFIQAFLAELHRHGEMYFGRVKEWIHSNCTNVPLPRRWEITENIEILYNWINAFGGNKYVIDRPNHSQRVRYLG
jgi:phosphatidylserine/phosphatidylglycerophosphate/cardiolipin synthase-like enzyme